MPPDRAGSGTFVPCGGRGGTLVKLVERLTTQKYADTNYLQQFLLTYRTFTTPAELLGLLAERFDMPDPLRAADWQLKTYNVGGERACCSPGPPPCRPCGKVLARRYTGRESWGHSHTPQRPSRLVSGMSGGCRVADRMTSSSFACALSTFSRFGWTSAFTISRRTTRSSKRLPTSSSPCLASAWTWLPRRCVTRCGGKGAASQVTGAAGAVRTNADLGYRPQFFACARVSRSSHGVAVPSSSPCRPRPRPSASGPQRHRRPNRSWRPCWRPHPCKWRST